MNPVAGKDRALSSLPHKRWRDVLPVHRACDLVPPIGADELQGLAKDIKAHGLRETVGLYHEQCADGSSVLKLLDGRSRLDALEMAGFAVVDDTGKLAPDLGLAAMGHEPPAQGAWVEIETDDPIAYVLSKNLHRRHLTHEQKRDLIAKVVKANPGKSNRQLAKTVKASPTTVATVRAKLEGTGDVSNLDTRRDTEGRQQPAHKPRRPKRSQEVIAAEEGAKAECKAAKQARHDSERRAQAERSAAVTSMAVLVLDLPELSVRSFVEKAEAAPFARISELVDAMRALRPEQFEDENE